MSYSMKKIIYDTFLNKTYGYQFFSPFRCLTIWQKVHLGAASESLTLNHSLVILLTITFMQSLESLKLINISSYIVDVWIHEIPHDWGLWGATPRNGMIITGIEVHTNSWHCNTSYNIRDRLIKEFCQLHQNHIQFLDGRIKTLRIWTCCEWQVLQLDSSAAVWILLLNIRSVLSSLSWRSLKLMNIIWLLLFVGT